jgi:hypothetical protein
MSNTVCRTIEEVVAAADRDADNDAPLTQAQADLVAAILAPYRGSPSHPDEDPCA